MNPVRAETLLEHAAWLRGLARALVRDADEAEDVLQETWLRAVARPPRSSRGLRTWLAAVVRTVALDRGRSARRRARRERRAVRTREATDPSVLAGRAELHRRLVDHVLALPEPGRSTVLLRYLEGMDPREIALRTGVPASTVRSRLHRALATLRTRLDRGTPGGRDAWTAALLPLTGLRSTSDGAALVAAKGALLVSAKVKVAAVVVVVVLLALAGWRLATPPAPTTRGEDATLARDPAKSADRTSRGAGEEGTASSRERPGWSDETAPAGSADVEGPTTVAVAGDAPVPPPGAVEGRVVVSGEAAPSLAKVVLEQVCEDGSERQIPVSVRPDGTFRAEGLVPGRYRLVATHPDLATRRTEWFELLEERGAGPFELSLAEGGTILVRVIGADERPLAGEPVAFHAYGAGVAGDGLTDADGAFRRERLPAGPYRVRWHATGAQVDRAVRVRAGRVAEVVLRRAASLAGRVVGPDGTHLSHAIVRLRAKGPDAGYTAFQASTDPEGRFEIRGILPGRYGIDVQALTRPLRPGYVCDAGEIELAAGDRLERLLRVTPTTLSGRVTRKDDGAPLSSFPQQVQISARRLEKGDGGGWSPVPDSNLMAFAGKDGRYDFVGLEPGRYRIWIYAFVGGLREQRRDVDVPTGGLRDVDFALETRRYGTLRLRVVGPGEDPAAGLSHGLVRREDGRETGTRSVRSEPAGPGVLAFRLEAGRRELRIGKPGFCAEPATVVVEIEPDSAVERTVRLIRSGGVRLTVIEPDGSRAEHARVLLLREGAEHRLSVRPLGAGTFRVFPHPGRVALRVETAAGSCGPIEVDVGADEAVIRTVRLRRR